MKPKSKRQRAKKDEHGPTSKPISITVDFDTALRAMLGTPPPKKGR